MNKPALKKMTARQLSEDQLDETLDKMIKDGIVEEVMVNGEPHYRLTAFGNMLAEGATTDPKKLN